MIRVSIEANDGMHLRQLLVGMLAGTSLAAVPAAAPAAPAAPAPQPEPRDSASDDTTQMQTTGPIEAQPEPPTPSEQRRRGRPAKAKAEPPAPTGEAPQPADDVPPTSPAALTAEPLGGGETPPTQAETPITGSVMDPKAPDVTDVRAALQSYAKAKGLPACGALLEKFGANQVSKLDPKNYAAFIAECAA